jgi:glycosyltransferase involved in cell wall biosynthesis
VGRYVRHLCDALRARGAGVPWRACAPRGLGRRARERYPDVALRTLPVSWPELMLLMTAGARLGVRFDALYGRPHLVHSPLGYGPRFRHARLLLTIHDLTFLDHPEWHPRRTALFLRLAVGAAAREAVRVFCDSEHIRRRIVAELGVPAGRTLTLAPPLSPHYRPLPADEARARVRARFGHEGPFVLHVGTLEPRKNHVTLIDAFERVRRAGFAGPLLLVGQDGWHVGPIASRIERSPERAAIRRIRDAADDDLVALYSACAVSVFPSLAEGFGYPVLEAMACGAPCVTSEDPALIELGAGVATAVPAVDSAALADELLAAIRDPESRTRAAYAGPRRAAPFRSDVWAGRLLACYREELSAAASGLPVTAPALRSAAP